MTRERSDLASVLVVDFRKKKDFEKEKGF